VAESKRASTTFLRGLSPTRNVSFIGARAHEGCQVRKEVLSHLSKWKSAYFLGFLSNSIVSKQK